ETPCRRDQRLLEIAVVIAGPSERAVPSSPFHGEAYARGAQAGKAVIVNGPAVRRRLVAFIHSVVAQDGSDSQPVTGKNAMSSFRLGGAMLLCLPPARDRILVAPKGKRKDLVGIGQALEPLNRQKAFDLHQRQ